MLVLVSTMKERDLVISAQTRPSPNYITVMLVRSCTKSQGIPLRPFAGQGNKSGQIHDVIGVLEDKDCLERIRCFYVRCIRIDYLPDLLQACYVRCMCIRIDDLPISSPINL